MKKLKIFVWIAVLLLIQTCLLPYIKIKNLAPELLFVFSVCYALQEKEWNFQFFVPILCGAAVDWMGGQFFGANTILYMLSSMLGIWAAGIFYQSGTIFQLPLIFVLSLLLGSGYFLLHAKSFLETGFGAVLWNMILPTAGLNTVCVLIMLPLMQKTLKQRR